VGGQGTISPLPGPSYEHAIKTVLNLYVSSFPLLCNAPRIFCSYFEALIFVLWPSIFIQAKDFGTKKKESGKHNLHTRLQN
jgi:hypothetical protein